MLPLQGVRVRSHMPSGTGKNKNKTKQTNKQKKSFWEFPGSPVVSALHFHCLGSVPGRGTKIDSASLEVRPGKKKKRIHHLMYSPLSQKTYINCVLTSNGQNSSQSFLRCFSRVISLKFGSNKIFQFLDQLINFSSTVPLRSDK